jgi:two-component system phosphate regulon sensor histidine kinase PhoR
MERNKRVYRYNDVDINAVVQNVVETFKPHFQKKEVEYWVDLTKDESLVYADKDAVSEVLVNLIDNAVKYSKESDKRITIMTKKTAKKFIISVEDNGIGISPKNQKHIFDKFYRVTKGNLAHHAKGAGLGLNIVQQIMKQHGGEVKIESSEGKGSIFHVVFPLKNN